MSLRFHWMLPKGGEVAMKTAQETSRVLTTKSTSPAALPDMEGWARFARSAEESGIESVLLSFSRYEPDTMLVACAVGQVAAKLKFIVAYRLGLMQPTTFVQQINTLSALIGGRVALNVVAGSSTLEQRGYGDFLEHDERYARADEFLAVCRSFWRGDGEVDFEGRYCRVEKGKLHTPFVAPDRAAPEVYVSGHSEQAQRLALTRGSSWLRLIDTPEKLRPMVARFREQGVEVSLRLCVVCRPTREEALAAAQALLPDEEIERQERAILSGSDSQTLKQALAAADEVGWLNRNLWAGLVPFYGSSAMTLVGTPEELAEAFLQYKQIGVTQFIISGWPKLDEMLIFGREVLPLVRRAETTLKEAAGG
jgi:alkanesulfonate monooxygenase